MTRSKGAPGLIGTFFLMLVLVIIILAIYAPGELQAALDAIIGGVR